MLGFLVEIGVERLENDFIYLVFIDVCLGGKIIFRVVGDVYSLGECS